MDERRRTPKKRKIPFKRRVAIAIVQTVEEREQKKQLKAQQKAQPKAQQKARRTAAPKRPAGQAQRPQTRTRAPREANERPPVRRQGGARQPMTAQQRQQRAQQIRRMRRRRTAIRAAAAAVVVVLIAVILSRTVLFKIQNIEVTNPKAANYTVDQIVTASGVIYGAQNLFTCDLKKTGKNIEQYLPYIGSAEVKRNFPSSLQVTVTPTRAAAALAFGTGYLLIDAQGKMLENAETAPDGIPVLRCKTEFETNLGQYIGVPAGGKKADDHTKAAAKMIALYKKVNAAVSEAKIDDITLIDIRDTRAITLMYQNRLTLHLGTEDLLEQKLKTAAKTIAAESDSSKTRTGAIDLTSVPYAYARDTYEPATGEDTSDVSEPESTTEAG